MTSELVSELKKDVLIIYEIIRKWGDNHEAATFLNNFIETTTYSYRETKIENEKEFLVKEITKLLFFFETMGVPKRVAERLEREKLNRRDLNSKNRGEGG